MKSTTATQSLRTFTQRLEYLVTFLTRSCCLEKGSGLPKEAKLHLLSDVSSEQSGGHLRCGWRGVLASEDRCARPGTSASEANEPTHTTPLRSVPHRSSPRSLLACMINTSNTPGQRPLRHVRPGNLGRRTRTCSKVISDDMLILFADRSSSEP